METPALQGIRLCMKSSCSKTAAVAYGDFFWPNRYRVEESAKFGTMFHFSARNKLRRGATWNNNPGGVRCDLIYPYIHQHESEAESQGETSLALFRDFESKKKKQKKDRLSILITHYAFFDVENCLFGIRTRKKVWKNQTAERREALRSETKRNKWKQASIKVENVSARYYQQGRAIFFFYSESKRFSVSRK